MVNIGNVKLHTYERALNTKFRNEDKWWEYIKDKKYEFSGGKIYGLLSEIGEGGNAISYILSGREKIKCEKLFISNNDIQKEYVENKRCQEGWLVGEGIGKHGAFNEKTIVNQIKTALKVSKSKYTASEIIDLFELSYDRINNKFSHMSWEGWRASVAIGFAMDKYVYCFPWKEKAYLKNIVLNTGFSFYINILKAEEKIVLIPSNDRKLLELFCDEVIEVKNHTEDEYKYIKDYFAGNPIIDK